MSTEPQKADRVMYIDHKGVAHRALVTAVNGLNPGYISLAYIDEKADERENIKHVLDVPNMDHESKQEVQTVQDPRESWNPKAVIQQGNPDLPTIHLNCWKYEWEDHTAPASDHPMFDHPFAPRPTDEQGRPVLKARPEYEAQVAEHQGRPATMAELGERLDRFAADIIANSPDAKIVDGKIVSASGAPHVAIPMGDVTFDAQQGTATTAAPTGADLDKVAEEQKAADATSGEPATN